MIKHYVAITKPKIIFGNGITAIGGFMLASLHAIQTPVFAAMLLGLSCIIASACVCNNYIDRAIDEKMARTKMRSLVIKAISGPQALLFASSLLLVGSMLLIAYTNMLTLSCALVGFAVYVFAYSPLKHSSPHATLVGSIAGACPIVVGYVAAKNCLDLGALLLFILVVLWQMPHFYAIALYRLDDYKQALVPVLPLTRGVLATKKEMLYYIAAFSIASVMPTLCGYTGYAYFTIALIASLSWLKICLQGFSCTDDTSWARRMFIYSLIVIMVLCGAMSFDGI